MARRDRVEISSGARQELVYRRRGFGTWPDQIRSQHACTSFGAGFHQFSIEKIVPRVARVRPTAEILAALGGAPHRVVLSPLPGLDV